MTHRTNREIRQRTQRVVDGLGDLDHRARALSREHPFVALGVAALLGFIVGRVASRA